jgi:hypothetical protein
MMPHSRREPDRSYEANPRTVSPEAARQIAMIRAAVPEEVQALRDRLPQVRASHPGNQAVHSATDEVSRALDALTLALVNALHGIDDPAKLRRQGHR